MQTVWSPFPKGVICVVSMEKRRHHMFACVVPDVIYATILNFINILQSLWNVPKITIEILVHELNTQVFYNK